ncbi:hypothetical protein DEU56DRAFT_475486 [Suillus clintonianus]|uniref:uncharacterized protein n=1 Tax=Suillus clintonianus TaxID=1904413 RepID=UPI001B867901|nr:uncharacterized protein DEU56DRAFT_475486 [Suillus clintonianus]KAG2153265.1 hypothetical protein DEU56DRAFT_475486 [Suillus clintonianus]
MPVVPQNLLWRQSILSATKKIFLILLMVNCRSLPFAWHIRIFLPFLRLHLQYYLLGLRNMFKPKKVRAKILDDWSEALCPIGTNPFELVTVQHGWATVDETDYNGHLSNSSYAKAHDVAAMKMIREGFPAFTRSGGSVALGSSHFNFIREIPVLARYEMRLSIGAWDNKWMFIIARYVSFPKKRRGDGRMDHHTKSTLGQQLGAPMTSLYFPRILRTHAENLATFPTLGDASGGDPNIQAEKTAQVTKGLAAVQSNTNEPDGAILHCVATTYVCFKHGRITVPPGIVLSCEGFSKPPNTASAAPFSPMNPPAHWKKVQALRVGLSGSAPVFARFLKGGWRDVPEGERWWEDALDGPIDEQRKTNFEIFDSIRKGMEQARSLR